MGRSIFFVGFLIIGADQISKYAVVSLSRPYVLNSGFSFGVGQGSSIWIFTILLFIVLFDSIKRGVHLFDALILAGGMGNVADRLWYGGVLDWIKVGTLWFNISDISITIGVIWIFLSSSWTIRS